jgi:hypothetical protein
MLNANAHKESVKGVTVSRDPASERVPEIIETIEK